LVISKILANLLFAIPAWWISLFNPPPLASMTPAQKVGRILVVTLSLSVSCILLAIATSLGVYVIERGHAMLVSVPELASGLEIIFVSVCVNIGCVFILLQIRKADRRLLTTETQGPGGS
jgi:hypothetical protein